MTSNLTEFPLRQSKRAQGLPPDFPPIAGERPMEAIDQGATVYSHVEECPAVEVGEEFTTYDIPFVKQPLMVYIAFHFPMESHVCSPNWVYRLFNDTEGTEYGPNAPFWRTSVGQANFEFGVTRPSFFNPPSNEEMYRSLQLTMDCLHNF